MPFDGAVSENVAIVRRMRDRLADPDKWCRGAYEDGDGRMCLFATYCLASGGAVDPWMSRLDREPVLRALTAEAIEFMPSARDFGYDAVAVICAFNNASTHAELLSYLAAVERRVAREA